MAILRRDEFPFAVTSANAITARQELADLRDRDVTQVDMGRERHAPITLAQTIMAATWPDMGRNPDPLAHRPDIFFEDDGSRVPPYILIRDRGEYSITVEPLLNVGLVMVTKKLPRTWRNFRAMLPYNERAGILMGAIDDQIVEPQERWSMLIEGGEGMEIFFPLAQRLAGIVLEAVDS